ncbi:MAG: SecDF P1 head subdomain-containing protein [Limisphaerales bacterium]
MNASPTPWFWIECLGFLLIPITLVLALAGLAARSVQPARWRRGLWIATFLAVGGLTLAWFAGIDREIAARLKPGDGDQPRFMVRSNLPVNGRPLREAAPTELSPISTFAESSLPAAPAPDVSPWWPLWLWFGGAVLVGGRAVASRIFLIWTWRFRAANAIATQPGLTGAGEVFHGEDAGSRVEALAARLGLHQRVRVVESSGLAAPIAFGWLRPTIGLPAGFWSAQSRSEQDAILAHELAHLAARDPVWMAVTDGLAAVLWWHPLLWWARRQFREASELAADEASLLIEDGPTVLAGCLVSLARTLEGRRANGWLGMAGFRSGLGRRVERLLTLKPDSEALRRRTSPLLVLGLGTVLVAIGLLSATALAWSRGAEKVPSLLAMAQVALATDPASAAATPGEALAGALDPSDDLGRGTAMSSDRQVRLLVLVQLPGVTAGERRSQTLLSMDALTRRLYATRRFGSVKCEPVEPDRIQVLLRVRDTNQLEGVKTAVEAPGRIEFRRVHPESESLVSSGALPARYEVLKDSATRGLNARSYLVERSPAQGLTNRHLAEATVVTNLMDSKPVVNVRFNAEGAGLFHELTRTSVGQMVAVVVDGEVLMAPRINEAIAVGQCQISGNFTEAEAGLLAAMLQTPLPTPLKLIEMTELEPAPPTSAGASAFPGVLPGPTGAAQSSSPAGLPPKRDRGGEAPLVSSTGPVATLVQDGRLLYELGKTEEAKAKLEAALNQEPENQAAQYYLRLVREAESNAQRRDRAAEGAEAGSALIHPTLPPRAVGVEDSGIASTNQLFTRTYRLDPNRVGEAFQKLTGSGATNLPPAEVLRRLLAAGGVDFGGTNTPNVFPGGTNAAVFQGASGKALFFQDRTGMLLARATAADLELIEQFLQLLNATPPQVVIEAKFVEISDANTQALGFDWFLGNQLMGGATNATGSNSVPMTVTGIMTDPQFRGVVQALETGGTNGVQELRGDQLDWPGRHATNAQNVRINAALGASVAGILTDPQFRVVLRGLEQRSGVDVLSAPRVTTLSERQAQIQVAEVRTVMTGIDPARIYVPGALPATNSLPFTMTSIPVGPVLDVIPVVSADGFTIQLTVTATVNEFLGYDQPPKDGRVRVWQDGKPRWVDPPLPRFRVRQVQTQAQVWDGQTLVLGGYPVEDQVFIKDKVPVLGDLPGVGAFFRNESKSTVRKQLLVFVTATIVDPAGNRVHEAAELPADSKTGVWPSKP